VTSRFYFARDHLYFTMCLYFTFIFYEIIFQLLVYFVYVTILLFELTLALVVVILILIVRLLFLLIVMLLLLLLLALAFTLILLATNNSYTINSQTTPTKDILKYFI